MPGAARIEFAGTSWASGCAAEIFRDRQLMAACSAQNCFRISLIAEPNGRWVISLSRMTFEAREPLTAAFEFDRDYIEFAMPVDAAGVGIDIDTADRFTVGS
jgi:hypothetical protein